MSAILSNMNMNKETTPKMATYSTSHSDNRRDQHSDIQSGSSRHGSNRNRSEGRCSWPRSDRCHGHKHSTHTHRNGRQPSSRHGNSMHCSNT